MTAKEFDEMLSLLRALNGALASASNMLADAEEYAYTIQRMLEPTEQ